MAEAMIGNRFFDIGFCRRRWELLRVHFSRECCVEQRLAVVVGRHHHKIRCASWRRGVGDEELGPLLFRTDEDRDSAIPPVVWSKLSWLIVEAVRILFTLFENIFHSVGGHTDQIKNNFTEGL